MGLARLLIGEPSEEQEIYAAGAGSLLGLVAVVGLRMTSPPNLPAWRDWLEGRVEQAVGKVTGENREYVAKIEGSRRPLKWLRMEWSDLEYSHVETLLLGNYTFYYLPHSRSILSATLLNETSDANAQSEVTTDLARVLGIGAADLAANTVGKLGPQQAFKLIRMAPVRLVGVILLGWVLLERTVEMWASRPSDFWDYFLLVLTVGLCGITCYVLARRCRQMLLDALSGRVRTTEGVLRKRFESHTTGGSGLIMTHYFTFSEGEFEVSSDLYDAVAARHIYRVYFGSHSRVIVGMALIAEGHTPNAK
jgi:hypothetical protein